MGGTSGTDRDMRGVYMILVVNVTKKKRPLRRLSLRWKDNIKIYLQEIG